jgi:hypothetical protein
LKATSLYRYHRKSHHNTEGTTAGGDSHHNTEGTTAGGDSKTKRLKMVAQCAAAALGHDQSKVVASMLAASTGLGSGSGNGDSGDSGDSGGGAGK